MPTAEAQLRQELKQVRDKLKSFDDLKEQERRLSNALDALTGKTERRLPPAPNARRRRNRHNIDREAIVAFLRKNSPASAIEINKHLGGVNSAILSQVLGQMSDQGVLSKTGQRRATRYAVKKA
ncbi:MAG: hypothetical protein ACXWP0_19945 [Ktedonobacterales bacterium]